MNYSNTEMNLTTLQKHIKTLLQLTQVKNKAKCSTSTAYISFSILKVLPTFDKLNFQPKVSNPKIINAAAYGNQTYDLPARQPLYAHGCNLSSGRWSITVHQDLGLQYIIYYLGMTIGVSSV